MEDWTVNWLKKWSTKNPEKIIKVNNEKYAEEENKRKLFYKWKKEIRIKTSDKLGYKNRFNNPLDRNIKLIGMRILEDEEINKRFKEWCKKETIKLTMFKYLEKNKHLLIGKDKIMYKKLKEEFKNVA